jgi:hypothetical protein
MTLVRVLLPVFGILATVGLPVGVVLTALFFEKERYLAWAGIGLVSLTGGIIFLEFAWRSVARTGGEANQVVDRSGLGQHGPKAIGALLLQVITVVLFAPIMDGGVHLRACEIAYAGYAAGAVLLLAKRPKALTKGDWLYLRWGWVPIIVIGVPLFMRVVWKGRGLM